MIIKLNKDEVEAACEYWLRAHQHAGFNDQCHTSNRAPVAIDKRMQIICNHTRSGVECYIERLES